MKRIEISKLLAIVVTVLFVLAVCFVLGIWAVTNKPPEQLEIGISILGVVSTPFGVVITGYFAKAGMENYQKIRKGHDNEHDTNP